MKVKELQDKLRICNEDADVADALKVLGIDLTPPEVVRIEAGDVYTAIQQLFDSDGLEIIVERIQDAVGYELNVTEEKFVDTILSDAAKSLTRPEGG